MCVQGRFLQIVIRTLCVLGVGMIMGDGVLTPAISVVSAIEGLGNVPGGGGNIPRSQSPSHNAFSPASAVHFWQSFAGRCVKFSCWRPAAVQFSIIQLELCACPELRVVRP